MTSSVDQLGATEFRWFRLVLQVSRLRRAGGRPVAVEITLR